jgi:hypothetical protein
MDTWGIQDVLWRYTWLRPDHVEALRDPGSASPAMRRALRDGGLLDEVPWEAARGIGRRVPDAKCLHHVRRHPGLALRFLRQVFGNAPLERLRKAIRSLTEREREAFF